MHGSITVIIIKTGERTSHQPNISDCTHCTLHGYCQAV